MMVYLVEDSPLLRDRLREEIGEIDSGIEVFEAVSAEDAIPAILELCPDIVVLDLKLAGASGLDVLKKVKRAESGSRVLVFTNHAEAFYRRKCLDLGADQFFDKSQDFGRVLEAIKTRRYGEERD
jgi:DNA-binding NarL/FixJ family response regulator